MITASSIRIVIVIFLRAISSNAFCMLALGPVDWTRVLLPKISFGPATARVTAELGLGLERERA